MKRPLVLLLGLFAMTASTSLLADPANPAVSLLDTNTPDAKIVTPADSGNSGTNSDTQEQLWNLHFQNTDIVQYHPGFSSLYTGPQSLSGTPAQAETVSADIYAGLRLWQAAQIHLDGLMYQGFGFDGTHGVAGFHNGEAFKIGTWIPKFNLARCFISQVFGFGGPQEMIQDDQTHLAGQQDISRLTVTAGRMSATDIFDNNTYAGSPRTQFMNWDFLSDAAWDFPADSLGFISGIAFDFNQKDWALRYGVFQVPDMINGMVEDDQILKAWAMVSEAERRFTINEHPGKLRFLAYMNQADMGNYQQSLDNMAAYGGPINIAATRTYSLKYGFGLNGEQEIVKDVGIFSRIGWSNGQTEDWMNTDVDWTATLGLSVAGSYWNRPNDTFGTAYAIDGLSAVHALYFNAGGQGLLLGDGSLNYATEQVSETYYSFQIAKGVTLTADYQFINNPGYNIVRGPVSVLSARAHFEF